MPNVCTISPTEKTQLDNILIISDNLAESVFLAKHYFKSKFKEIHLLYLAFKYGEFYTIERLSILNPN